jgi:ABC-2 type transport system permease protein
MRVMDLAIKDLRQILRDWRSALFLAIMPILFTLFFGVILNPVFSQETEGDPRLPVGVVNLDQSGELGVELMRLIEASDAIRPEAFEAPDAQEAERQVADQELAAAVMIPAGFSEGLLADEPVRLQVVADPDAPAGRTALSALERGGGQLLGAVEAARLSADAFEQQEGFDSAAARQDFLGQALTQAAAAWQAPSIGVAIEKATGANTDETDLENGFVQSSPGMIVQFAIFGLINSAMVLVLERKSRALKRLLTTPIRPAAVIGGHTLAMFIVVFAQQILLIGLGQFVFGVDYLRAPVATVLMMAALAIWSASLGLLIGAFSKGEDQVVTLSMIAMFLFSALGGAWFPLEVTGETFAAIGHVTPTAWAMDGFQNIVVRGQGLGAVLLPAGLLVIYAAAFFALAVWRFRFE